MSDNESYDYDNESSISDDDNSSTENTFKPAIKIGPKITLTGVGNPDEDDESEEMSYVSDSDIGDDESIKPLGGVDTDEEFDDDDDDDIDVPNFPKPPNEGDVDEDDDDDMDYDRTPKEKTVDDEEDSDEDEESDEDSEEEYDEDYLKKFDREVIDNFIEEYHPEAVAHNFDEVKTMSNVVRNAEGIIVDKLHRTLPILTKFEKARVLGIRAKQLNDGAPAFIKTPPTIIDGYTIARMELAEKVMPFIIRRPLPNGGCEYWKIADLELI